MTSFEKFLAAVRLAASASDLGQTHRIRVWPEAENSVALRTEPIQPSCVPERFYMLTRQNGDHHLPTRWAVVAFDSYESWAHASTLAAQCAAEQLVVYSMIPTDAVTDVAYRELAAWFVRMVERIRGLELD